MTIRNLYIKNFQFSLRLFCDRIAQGFYRFIFFYYIRSLIYNIDDLLVKGQILEF